MSMTLKTRKEDGVVVVEMTGRFTIGEPVLLFRETVRKFMEDGSHTFLLNLKDISFIDSSGLGEMIAAFTRVRRENGDIKLVHLTKSAKDLLQMCKLLTVFDTFDDEAKAVLSLSKKAAHSS
jgi:anti-sigma B factor antagonist